MDFNKLKLKFEPEIEDEEDKWAKLKAKFEPMEVEDVTTPATTTTPIQTQIGTGAETMGGAVVPKPAEESKLKDIWDAVRLTWSGMVHHSKQAFHSAFPNFFFQDISPEETRQIEQKYGLPEDSITEEAIQKINEKNKKRRDIGEAKYQEGEANYQKWLKDNPELMPRKEWEKGFVETVKANPKILLDPAYLAYSVANSAIMSWAVKGTMLGVGVMTGNPVLLGLAGVAITVPFHIQELNEELMENGATEEQAAALSVPIGTAIATVEAVGDLPFLLAASPAFRKLFTNQVKKEVVKGVIKKGLLKRGVLTTGKILASETLEEDVQLWMTNAAVSTVNENRDILEGTLETTLSSLYVILPTALLGGGADIKSNIKQKIDDVKGKEVVEEQETLQEAIKEEPEVNLEEKREMLRKRGIKEELLTDEFVKKAKITELPKADVTTEKVTEKTISKLEEKWGKEPELTKEKVLEKVEPPKGKVSKIAEDIEIKAIETGLTEGFGHLAEYTPITIKEQARRAFDLINTNIDEARRIIRGEKPLPEGLKGTALITAMEEQIKKTADGELASELAASPLVSGTSAAAQELRLAAERDPTSPVKAIQDVNKILDETAKRKLPCKILGKAKADIVSKIKNNIKNANTTQSWKTFIESIRC